MMYVLVVLCAAAGLAWFEVPRLLKRKWIKEMGAFFAFLLIGITLAALWILHVPIQSPVDWIEQLFTPISDGINALLGYK